MNLLLWNTYKNANTDNINNSLYEIISEKCCDYIMLAEYNDDIFHLCNCINLKSNDEYMVIPNNGGCDRIKGLIKKKYNINSIREQTHYQIIIIETTNYKLIIAMVHNVSKLNVSDYIQEEKLRRLHHDIREEEIRYNTANTIIIGDFNVNPFEKACVSADTLHAIPFSHEIKIPTRTIQEIEYFKFYNPTWKLFSNRNVPYTTYYYNNSDMVNFYWNMYDQVIIRPILVDAFDDNSLEILQSTKNHISLKNNKPDKNNYSDHLPLFFAVKEGYIK